MAAPIPSAPIQPGDTWRMEQFCRAYVQAVAAAAGCYILTWLVDVDHIDLTLARKADLALVRGARLDIQLKATCGKYRRQQYVRFPLDIATYDKLRATNVMVPQILVVLLMHPEVADWTHHTEARLALRRCAYWRSLRGEPRVANRTTKTVRLPRLQVFNAQAVHDIFTRIENGGLP